MGERIVVIGAVAAGTKAAARARRLDAGAAITVLTEENDVSYAGCGLPYYVGNVIKERRELVVRDPESFKADDSIEIMTRTRAASIDRERKRVIAVDLDDGREFEVHYDALVLATGAKAILPDVPGIHLDGVFTLRSVADADLLKSFIGARAPRSAAVVGGGFIGLETAENLASLGIGVTLIEMMEHFPPGFDPDVSALIGNCVRENGVTVLAGERVAAIEGSRGLVQSVRTSGGSVEADLVVMAVGVRPNTGLAMEAGLGVSRNGAILVDEYMRTTDPHIYAVGDCAATTNLLTGDGAWFPLGSTANKMGRIAGTRAGRSDGGAGSTQALKGVLGTSIFKVFGLNCGRTGMTLRESLDRGHDAVSCTVPAPDRAHYYPGARDIIVRLIADRSTRRVLGAQVVGSGVVDKPVDILATAITLGATVDDLATLDLAYAPPYSSAMAPTITAANVLLNKMDGLLEGITASELKARLADPELLLLDVRSEPEFIVSHIDGSVNVPVEDLVARVGEVDRSKEIVVICRVGKRAYRAYLALKARGFDRVEILDGGMCAYPYDTV